MMIMINSIEERQVREFFNSDLINLKEYPIEEVRKIFTPCNKTNYKFDLTNIHSETKKQQLKDYLYLVIYKGEPITVNAKSFHYLFRFPELMNELSGDSIIEMDLEVATKETINYFFEKGYTYKTETTRLFNTMQLALLEYYDSKTIEKPLDRNIWRLDKMKISEERLNNSAPVKRLNFYSFTNEENRSLVKSWMKYLLTCTEIAVSTIRNDFTMILLFADIIGEKSFLDVVPKDVEIFAKSIKKKNDRDYNKHLTCISSFYEYLMVKKIFTSDLPVNKALFRKTKRQPIVSNTVSDFTVLQIFNHLHELPFDLMCVFLIDFASGMRISDILQLKTDCVYKDKESYFIKYDVQKMSKQHAVLIPEALFDLLQQQIKIVSKYKGKYLFPAAKDKNTPMRTNYYRKTMKKWCTQWGITNEDGSAYDFKTHAYRHTIATDLFQNYNVSIEVIQLAVLGHANIDMSLSYAERNDDYKKLLEDRYVGKTGELNPLYDKTDAKALETVEWLKDGLNKHVLSNGLCAYPTKLGVCPNMDICLDCEHFRTSKKFLPVLKEQLSTIEARIPLYESNKWMPNLLTAQKQKAQLEAIITKLQSL